MASLVMVIAVAIGLLGVMAGSSGAAAGDTTRVSVNSSGNQANGGSYVPFVSSDGRFVAFYSDASNLVPDDTNRWIDVFVRDRQTGTIQRVSVSSSGNQANSDSYWPSISSDGRFVTFYSDASNLVPGDTKYTTDVYVRDLQAGTTQKVNVSSSGAQANGLESYLPSISSDGRFVAFESDASNLVAKDTNRNYDVFVRDLQAGTTERVSVNSSGDQANHWSGAPTISSDGRYVAFESYASNLVKRDTNHHTDVFVRDLQTGTTKRVSVSSSGAQTNRESYGSSISSDGRFVAFFSDASNLVAKDTNRAADVFVRDLQTGTTKRVSVSSSGNQANSDSYWPSISSDGRFVAFGSYASKLVPGDTNDILDVFVRDLQTGITQRVSVSSSGAQANGGSESPSISSDGRFVAFDSGASKLVANDTNRSTDVFVHEFEVDTTAPKVASVVPAEGATGVSRTINVKATFSERVYNVKDNFKLYPDGSGTPVDAMVKPVEGASYSMWVLNPYGPLKVRTTYVAKVKTGVKDKVGHSLDQYPDKAGDQPMKWTFKTGS